MMQYTGALPRQDPRYVNSVQNLPSALLRAELDRRQNRQKKPTCGTEGKQEYYNTPLHVAAVVIILALSTLACSFPIIARRFPRLPIPHRFLFLSRHFGTGVLIATAFVHLLPTAFVSLTDPCLPYFWSEGYPAMPGLIAMSSVFLVVSIEMFFATRGAGHMHGSEWETIPMGRACNPSLRRGHTSTSFSEQGDEQQSSGGIELGNGRISMHRLSGSGERLVNSHAKPAEGSEMGSADFDSDLDALDLVSDSHHIHPHVHASHRHSSADQNPQKLLLQCLLLEAGILFHSIFIGMALSVATGTSFLVLLVAISFHQTFEGLALGSRISALIPSLFNATSAKPWLMALAYGTTTPIGQAVGLWMHELYDPASTMGLLMVGITNAISSGLLLFAGLVELLAEDFLSDRSYEELKGRRRIEACISVACGGALMAIVGAFA